MMRLLSLIAVSVLLLAHAAFSQQREYPKYLYKYSAEDIRDYCWKNTDPNFTENNYPAEWDSASAVFLHYSDYYESCATTGSNRALSALFHRRVKLLDAAAVQNYSEIYLNSSSHGSYQLEYVARQKNFLGVKVIKPDGREIIMDDSKIIDGDKKQKKLAVSNLEVGDIIDYYVFTYDFMLKYGETMGWYSIIDKFAPQGKYPIKHFDYNLVTDKHWDVLFYASDELTVKEEKLTVPKKAYQFSIHKDNISASSTQLWNYIFQTEPYLKVMVRSQFKGLTKREKKKAPTLRITKLETDKILKEYKLYYAKSNLAANEYREFEKYLQTNNKTNLSGRALFEEYYYYMRHDFINRNYIRNRYNNNFSRNTSFSDNLFIGHLLYGLDKFKIPYDIIVVVPRNAGNIENVIDIHETDYIVRAKTEDPIYFYMPSVTSRFDIVPSSIESSTGYIITSQTNKAKDLAIEKFTLPASDYKENLEEHTIALSFNPADETILDAKTQIQFSGHQMNSRFDLINYADMIWSEDRTYGKKEWGKPELAKGDDKIAKTAFYESIEKERIEAIKKLAKETFDKETTVKDVVNTVTSSTGNFVGDDKLSVSFDCQLEQLVKKVGPNYIISLGKIVGSQLTLAPNEMKRDIDIYMDFARGYTHTVRMQIPDGYEVKGLEKFNFDIDNKTGQLKSTATVENGMLTFTFEKYYKVNNYKAEDWELLKAFIIPASEFHANEILLKKL